MSDSEKNFNNFDMPKCAGLPRSHSLRLRLGVMFVYLAIMKHNTVNCLLFAIIRASTQWLFRSPLFCQNAIAVDTHRRVDCNSSRLIAASLQLFFLPSLPFVSPLPPVLCVMLDLFLVQSLG